MGTTSKNDREGERRTHRDLNVRKSLLPRELNILYFDVSALHATEQHNIESAVQARKTEGKSVVGRRGKAREGKR